jgi:GABA(A) receptor-associated protein
MVTVASFKTRFTFEERSTEAAQVRTRYPDRFPVIIETVDGTASSIKLDKHKFLVPTALTCGQFMYVIRKRMQLAPEVALFLMYGNDTMVTSAMSMGEAYQLHGDSDGFLYAYLTGENTYGGCNIADIHVRPVGETVF